MKFNPLGRSGVKVSELCYGTMPFGGGAENADSIIVASEPLTKDTSAWVELPEYGALFAEVRNGRPRVAVRLLD